MSETKKTVKFFFLPDYEKEEKYLTEMHKKGWRFKKTNLFVYTFEKCEPENVIYKIDFAGVKKDMDSYTRMYADYGWEYLQDFNDFSYFRKSADGMKPEEMEIFSDTESKAAMVNKIINTKLILILGLFLCIFPINIFSIAGYDWTPRPFIVFQIFHVLIMFMLFCIITYCAVGLIKLKNKFKQE